MTRDSDAAFFKRVARYTTLGVLGVYLAPIGLIWGLAGWKELLPPLAELPPSLVAMLALCWAIAYRREYRYPEAKPLLKRGAVWMATLMPCAILCSLFLQSPEDLSAGTVLIVTLLFGTFGVLAGPVAFGFWLFVVHRVWRESWSLTETTSE